jgi:predicted RNA-binding Zn-ribbon protein involved in translation (DUF1610 family)
VDHPPPNLSNISCLCPLTCGQVLVSLREVRHRWPSNHYQCRKSGQPQK